MQMQAEHELLFPNSLDTLLLAQHGRIPRILRLQTINWMDGLCDSVLVSGIRCVFCCS